ncbi:MAG: ATP-binding protein [Bacteroidota bacterium]
MSNNQIPHSLINSLVYQNSESLIFVLTLDFTIVHANNATLTFLATSFENITLKPFVEVIPISKRDYYDLTLTDINGQYPMVSCTFFDANNYPTNYRGKIEQEVHDEITYLVVVFNKRFDVEETLQVAVNRFSKIFDNISIGIILIEEKKPVYINQKISDITGYTIKELFDIKAIDLVVPEDYARVDAFSKQYFSGFESDVFIEFWAYKKDKSRIYIRNEYVYGDGYLFVIIRELTGEKIGEITRLHTEERSNAILNAIPDMMFLFDMNGIIIDYHYNDEYHLYKRPEDFLFKHLSYVLPPYLVDLIMSKIELVIKSVENVVFEYELEINGLNGLFECRLVRCGENSFLSIVRDITKQKQMIEALQESELRFRNTLENAPVSIFIVDENGVLLYANTKTFELFECVEFEIINRIISPQLWLTTSQREEWFEAVLQCGSLWNHEVEFITEKNNRIWTILSSEKIKYQNKTAMLSTLLDITQRRQTEIDLRRRDAVLDGVSYFASKCLSASSYETILAETLPKIGRSLKVGGVCMFQFEDENIARRKYLWLNELLVGVEYRDFMDSYNLLQYGLTYWIKTLSQNKSVIGKVSSFSDSEHKLWTQIHVKTYLLMPIFVQKKLWGFLGFDDYLEERTWMSPELDSLKTAADILGAAISRENAFNELLKAKENAEELNKLKTNFLSNMSHELRTPLIGILGSAEIIVNEKSLDEANKWAKIIKNSGNRLLESLNLILDFSKLEANKVSLNLQLINIVDVVNDVASLFNSVAISKNVSLTVSCECESVIAQVDVRLFRESLNNLVNNALKFTSKGSVNIVLSVVNSNVVIQVMDTGIGIPDNKINLIFEEFRQESEGLNRGFEGTGLGLTITKRFIEMMKGRIHVESEYGVGTVFTIYLPLHQNEPIPNSFVFSNVINDDEYSADKKFKNIHSVLLVENDEVSKLLIEKILGDEFVITYVENGEKALEIVKSQMFSLVLMDINLGKGMNGLEVTQALRKMVMFSNTPIVAITAFAIDGDQEEFISKGCSHYLSKPFTKNQLISLLKEIDQSLN